MKGLVEPHADTVGDGCETVGMKGLVEPRADSVEVLESAWCRKPACMENTIGFTACLHAWLEKDCCLLIHMESDPMKQQRERESILVCRPLYPNELNQLEELQ